MRVVKPELAEVRAYHKAWREKNAEHLREYNRKQREKNRDIYRETHRKWVADHPERNTEHKLKWYLENKDEENYKSRCLENRRRSYWKNPEKSRETVARWQRNNPDKVKLMQRRWHHGVAYGITLEQRIELFNQQGKACAICKTTSSAGRGFHLDHCHATKKVRGILCHHCNLMIGQAKDRVETLERAIRYLKRTAPKLPKFPKVAIITTRSEWRSANLRIAYGITLEQWSWLFAEQSGLCGICTRPPRESEIFHTDHCHTSDEIRGILCRGCNHMLGKAKDCITTIEAAIIYLQKEKRIA
jgi:hypothetical protein